MTRDPNGTIWFNINPGKGGLAKLDSKTDKIEVFIPPEGMAPTGGATTVDYDGRHDLGVLAHRRAAVRSDGREVQRVQVADAEVRHRGVGLTYGVAADRDGNGYWRRWRSTRSASATASTARQGAQAAGNAAVRDRFSPSRPPSTTASARPTSRTRSLCAGAAPHGHDKNDDVLYIGNSWAGTSPR